MEIQGIKWTNSSLIEKEIQPALKASTFGEIIQELNQACHRLSHLGIFKEMDVVIDTSPEYRDKYNEVDVTIIVKEKPRLFLKTGTEIGSDEGSLVGSKFFWLRHIKCLVEPLCKFAQCIWLCRDC